MSILENFVKLEPEVPTTMHFTKGLIVDKTITDPLTGVVKAARSLQFTVDRLGARKVDMTFGTLSEKLAEQLYPYVKDGTLLKYDFTITLHGKGYLTSYSVSVTPHRE